MGEVGGRSASLPVRSCADGRIVVDGEGGWSGAGGRSIASIELRIGSMHRWGLDVCRVLDAEY